ncbi:hypothetical protein Tco_0803455 [Tanacetum coccineum]|uniref:Uncharacterized protein n=1 Tax=Tanacetum coccineum TaxID=301880 RepID=A0ABQ5A5C2_9ASTR
MVNTRTDVELADAMLLQIRQQVREEYRTDAVAFRVVHRSVILRLAGFLGLAAGTAEEPGGRTTLGEDYDRLSSLKRGEKSEVPVSAGHLAESSGVDYAKGAECGRRIDTQRVVSFSCFLGTCLNMLAGWSSSARDCKKKNTGQIALSRSSFHLLIHLFPLLLDIRTAMLPHFYVFCHDPLHVDFMTYSIARAIYTHDHDLHDLPPSHGGTMTVTHEAPVGVWVHPSLHVYTFMVIGWCVLYIPSHWS